MKKLFSLSAVIVFAFVISAVQSCQSASKASNSTLFKLNLEPGRGYDYEMIADLATKVKGMESNILITSLYSMNVTGIDAGVRSIETYYRSFRMNMDVMGMHLEVDSDKPINNDEKDIKKNPLGMMNKVISGLVGKKFVIKVNEEGKVLEVQGFEKLITGMVDSMGLSESEKAMAMASLKDQFNDQNIKDQFSMIFTIFPNKTIKVGDTWQKTYTTGGKMGAAYTNNYTVKEIEGNSVSLTSSTEIGSNETGREIKGVQTGNIIVDSKTGLVISGDYDQNFTVMSEGQTVEVKGKSKIRGKAN